MQVGQFSNHTWEDNKDTASVAKAQVALLHNFVT